MTSLPTVTQPLVTLRDLRVELGGNPILRGVTAGISRGNITALIGLNGSGKTTLLRALVNEYPHKGTIAPGSDADIVIYNPSASQTLGVDMHHMAVDYSAYEGEVIAGNVELVMSRGRVVIEGGEYLGAKGDGRFVKRALSDVLI